MAAVSKHKNGMNAAYKEQNQVQKKEKYSLHFFLLNDSTGKV